MVCGGTSAPIRRSRRVMAQWPQAEISFNYLGQLDRVLQSDGRLLECRIGRRRASRARAGKVISV